MRLLVIGLDSACFPILDVTNRLGITPHLERLINEGFSARMKSTVPSITPPAWTTAGTGVMPDRHGVVSFCRPDAETGLVRPTSGRDRLVRSVVDYLADDGISSGLVNMPWTYPPSTSTEFCVSGFDAPRLAPDACHPPEALEVVLRAAPEYAVHPVGLRDTERALAATESRVDAILALCRWRPVEVLLTVFMATDSIAHVEWPDDLEAMVAEHPLARSYHVADDAVGRLIEELSPENVVVLSDHGMGACHSLVNLSRPLFDAGLMKPAGGWQAQLVAPFYRAARSAYRRMRARGGAAIGRGPRPTAGPGRFAPRVDWAGSLAHAGYGFGIVAVPDGSQAALDRAREAISSCAERHDPNPIRAMQQGGPLPGLPGSIALVCEIDLHAGYWLCPPILDPSEPFLIRDEKHPAYQRAGHRLHGLFIANGPETPVGVRGEDVAIEDVCPTLLHLAGASVPSGLDGRLMVSCFSQEALMARPPAIQHMRLERTETVNSARKEDDEVVSERLRDLGYL